MRIDSEPLLAQLERRMRRGRSDGSRHLLCPSCKKRTKLYALSDGRRKCGTCLTKFSPAKKTDALRLRQCADILLCFCMDFPAQQASDFTGYRYRLVSALYDRFRRLLAEQNLVHGKIMLITAVQPCGRAVHDSAFCKRCKGRFRCKGRAAGDAPVFGVKMVGGKEAFIDPLTDDEANFRFDHMPEGDAAMRRRFSGYAGFICKGTFHRFSDNPRERDGVEQLWSWMSQRLKRYHGIRRGNIGFYLKELEWKYNNRRLRPEARAAKLAALVPGDALETWPVRR
ncbi:MAG TPA: hypothetical protein PKV72_05295 [Candidatus Peribacteria bacterium]|nr:hypothetical protein [Candidatus Peribacteria bacterium]